MIGVRRPSRVVRPDIMRGLLVVAAVVAIGMGQHGHGLRGAADSKSDSKFVDPFLAEDVDAPSDDEIPGIPDFELPADSPGKKADTVRVEVELIPDLELPADLDGPSDPPIEIDWAKKPDAGQKKTSDKNSAVKNAVKSDKDSGASPDPFSELDADLNPQNMPKVHAPRLTRDIKKTALPKLDSDQDSIPDSDLELPDHTKGQPKLPSLKNLPNGGKSGWKSSALEPPGPSDAGKIAGGGPPAESARFERSGDLDDLKEPIEKIVIEGNKTIKTEEIRKLIKTREGRVPDPKLIKEDVRTLVSKRWFFNVETRVAQSKDGPGKVLVFKVTERPMLSKITYVGNKKIKEKALNELTGLKVNGGYDVGANREAAHRILMHYQEKGYLHAKVELEKGDTPTDREVVFKITEGPKVVVNKITIKGNKYFPTSVLKTQIKTKKVILWYFGGKYDPSSTRDDIDSLKKYYQDLGFFDVQISEKTTKSEDESKIHLEYTIEEGPRYRIRNIEFVGNRVLSADKLLDGLKVKPGDLYAQRHVNVDREKIVAQYGELGRIRAKVEPRTRSYENSPDVDLVYDINEDRAYRVGRINVHIHGDHPHTKESAVLTKLTFKPGELANQAKIEKSKQRLKNCQLFAGGMPGQNGAQQGTSPPEIVVKDSVLPTPRRDFNLVRGQDEGADKPPPNKQQSAEPAADEGFSSIFRGQNPTNGGQFDNPPFGDPQDGSSPGGYFPEEEPPFQDFDIHVFEAQTGRINMGVAVNSNAGLMGNVVLEENNFDILKPPASMQEILDGTAFRGGGQQFRIEAMPGIQVSRYLVSWRDPYFLDQNVMLGVSGSYFQRFYLNWTERREGGRVTLGHQFSPTLSGSLTARAEDVRITNPSVPIPPDYQAVLGDTFLSTVRASMVHDTRDSPMLPGRGHYFEAGVEQGIANFVYQKYDIDLRKHFLVRERPDGGNRQVISIFSNFGWIGNQAPFYERFFAGGNGFNTFRGFQFQGVTPRVDGVRIGGQFMALGTLEYLMPITADNSIQVVAFTDLGTVDSTVTFSNYRQSVGMGLRLTVPMLGPFPIAIDFAVPITRQPFDTTQVVSFNMGAQR